MTLTTLENEIQEAIPILFNTARNLTRNSISENYKFILTEINISSENFHEQRKMNKKINDKKVPLSLTELVPTLQRLYNNFYDINLHIYRATKSMTLIDFRYYPKSSLDKDYREKIMSNPPMLHCKVSMPPWLSEKEKKFDINWEHYEGLNRLRLLWFKLKLNPKCG